MNTIKKFIQEDLPATYSAAKWRINLVQLKNQLTNLENQKNDLLGELGTKAWKARVKNEVYSTIFNKLEELDGLVVQSQQEIDAVQKKINLETDHLNTTNAEFDARSKGIQNQRQAALQKLTPLQAAQKSIEQRISQIQGTINQNAVNLQNLKDQISQIQASEQVDKEPKIASLQNTIASVQMQIDEAVLQINTAKAELASNQAEQTPISSEIDGYNQLITMLQDQNKLALDPIQQQLKLFHSDLLKADEKKIGMENQLTAMMPEFGSQINRYRPLSDVLTEEYTALDSVQSEVKATGDQINLTQARLASVNSRSLHKVGLTCGSLVIIIGMIVCCISIIIPLIFPSVSTMLSPDSKSNIKLVESWTLENCSSTGGYIDVSIWQNLRRDAVANAKGDVILLGTNNVVLDSETSQMVIAPGGMALTIVGLEPGGSRVKEIKRSINTVLFTRASTIGQNNLDVRTYFEKSQSSNNIGLGLEITNKSDTRIEFFGNPYALVVNKQNKIIDVLMGMPDSNTIDVDLMSKVSFQRTNWYDLPSCLQSDYTNEEVTFWYFVPVQTNTNWGNQFMVSGKAVYKP